MDRLDDSRFSFEPYISYKILLMAIVLMEVIILLFGFYMVLCYRCFSIVFFCLPMTIVALIIGFKLFQYYPLHVEISEKKILMKNMRTKEIYSSSMIDFQRVYILADYGRYMYIVFSKEIMNYEKQKLLISQFFSYTNLRLSLDGNIVIVANFEKCKKIVDIIQSQIIIDDLSDNPHVWRW